VTLRAAMTFQDQLLARMEQDLATLVASARALMQRRQFADASKLLGDGYRQLFGLDRRFLQMMRPEEVAQILGQPQKLRAFGELMAEEADLLRLQHDLQSAAATASWTARILESAKLRDEVLLARLHALADLVG
jgi:hypothetical protein